MFDDILTALQSTSFPLSRTRSNVSAPARAFCLGDVHYWGQAGVDFKTRGPSRHNSSNSDLLSLLKLFISSAPGVPPDFSFTTIQLNKNRQCLPHVDKNNIGDSVIVALGDFEGGELLIEGKTYDIHNKCLLFA